MGTTREWAPIVQERPFGWEKAHAVPIDECLEELVPASLVPERLLAHPVYFLNGLGGAIAECYVRRRVLSLLLEAARLLPSGLRLVLLDGWRPPSLQSLLCNRYCAELRETMPDKDGGYISRMASRFVAAPSTDPGRHSPHVTGGAVDITIVDKNGLLLDMGSVFDETTDRSETVYYEKKVLSGGATSEKTLIVLENRRILYKAMAGAGFTNFPDEWWHYDFGNQNWAFMRWEKTAFYVVCEPFFRWNSNRRMQ